MRRGRRRRRGRGRVGRSRRVRVVRGRRGRGIARRTKWTPRRNKSQVSSLPTSVQTNTLSLRGGFTSAFFFAATNIECNLNQSNVTMTLNRPEPPPTGLTIARPHYQSLGSLSRRERSSSQECNRETRQSSTHLRKNPRNIGLYEK